MLLAVSAIGLFVAAVLLFWVQPLVAKLLLPPLGGSPAVWNSCMLFFQAALLAGYLYAHAGARWLGPRLQALLHVALLIVAAAALPIAAIPGLRPPDKTAALVPWLMLVLAGMVGAPFAVAAGTAPMIQRWFAASGHRHAADPYFLYAASNLGSLAALIAFPLLLEPGLTLAQQGQAWTACYAVLILLTIACALAARGGSRRDLPGTIAAPQDAGALALSFGRRALWVLLAFVPSSLLLGVTTYVTTDLAAVPLLWIVPLTLYLLSYVAAFSRHGPLATRIAAVAQPALIVLIAVVPIYDFTGDWWQLMLLHLAAFAMTAMLGHGRLAALRPPTARLTEFYLWIAVGGVLGGLFNALAAPLLFDQVIEYPLMIAAACLLLPGAWPAARDKAAALLDIVIPAGLVLLFLSQSRIAFYLVDDDLDDSWLPLLVAGAWAFALYLAASRPLRLGLAIGGLMFAAMFGLGQLDIVHRERSFFGTLKIEEDADAGLRYLKHGTTIHGIQSLVAEKRLRPLGYYHPDGPVGEVFAAIGGSERTRRVGVIGLGAGALACFGRADEDWTFFEIDPAVVRIARDPRWFTFLADCPPKAKVVLGDARLSLAREPGQRFDLLIVDAFTSDAIPIHLMTREAIALYMSRLGANGLLLVHISNRYFDLEPVLGRIAESLGLEAQIREYDPDREEETERGDWTSGSTWVILAATVEALAFLDDNDDWQPLSAAPGRPWSDDFSNVLGALR